jgi:hypothetical protein
MNSFYHQPADAAFESIREPRAAVLEYRKCLLKRQLVGSTLIVDG